MTQPNQNPQSEIDGASFPEWQLIPNGATHAQAAEISEAYHKGEPMPTTGNERVDAISDRLTRNSGYGKYSDFDED